MNKRSRKLPSPVKTEGTRKRTNSNYGVITYGPDYAFSRTDYSGTQYTESEGHPFHSHKGAKGLGDLGGEFLTRRSYIQGISPKRYKESYTSGDPKGSNWYRDDFDGPLLAVNPGLVSTSGNFQFPPSAESSNSALDALGATAIAHCAPGNPPANVVTFLGELLKDGLPSLVGIKTWENRTRNLKKQFRVGGDEYLNLQFGWAPLVSDITSLSQAIVHADKVLAQYERDAGKVVRRRFEFPTQKKVEEVSLGPASAYIGGDFSFSFPGSTLGRLVRRRETSIDRWFSGAFTYYLPAGYESRIGMVSAARKAQHLLGATINPDVLWELTPWSWAIDWFSNTGDVIHNLGRFADGGLVMRYGYMMEHSIVKDIYTLEDGNGVLRGRYPVSPVVMVTETKRRRKANPFGFGLSWSDLSTFQQSILAALGITRGVR